VVLVVVVVVLRDGEAGSGWAERDHGKIPASFWLLPTETGDENEMRCQNNDTLL
jgi:hypothetical protein